jgi:hypothetical protein
MIVDLWSSCVSRGATFFGFSTLLALTATGKQGPDDFVAKDNKRGHGSKPFGGRAIACRITPAAGLRFCITCESHHGASAALQDAV